MNLLLVLILIVPLSISSAVPKAEAAAAIKARLEAALKAPSRAYSFASKLELHAHIKAVAKLYDLPPKLLKQIVAVESANCRYRTNARTKDFGCAQVNALTIKGYKWNARTVIHNDRLNIVAAAIVLADLRKLTKKRLGEKWPCSYNIGLRNLKKSCDVYLEKLASITL